MTVLAESGERALEILTKRSFDLVMTDLLMHEVTGWQVLETTKRQYPDTKVIVFTGYVDEHGEALLVDRKADGFLVKPIEIEKLRKMLSGLLLDEEVVGGRIIAVDDEKITQMMIEITLVDAGHEVRLFSSAPEALAAAKADPPDLFLIDIEMPHVDGFELCAQIRDLDVTCDIPIIIVTAHSDRPTVTRALGLGIQGFIVKPHEPEALIDKVKKTLAQSQKGRVS